MALEDKDDQVRQAALHSIAVWRDATASDRLAKMVGPGSSPPNRRAAAEALGRIGKPEAVAPLLAGAADCHDRALEHSIIYAMMEINDPNPVRAGLASKHPGTVRAAVIALDQMDQKTLKAEEVAPLLAVQGDSIRDAVWWVTDRHPDWAPVATAQLRSRLLDPQTSAEELNKLSARLALFARQPAVAEFVLGALRSPATPTATKLALLNIIASRGPQQLQGAWVDAVLDLLSSPDRILMARTVSTLRGLTGAALDGRIVARLQQLASETSSPAVFRLEALATAQAAGAVARKGRPSTYELSEELFTFLASNLSLQQPLSTRLLVVDIVLGSKLSAVQREKLCSALADVGPVELMRMLPVLVQRGNLELGKKLLAVLANHAALTSLDAKALQTSLAGLDPSLAADTKNLIVKIDAANADKLRQLTAMMEVVKQGNVARGQQVFYSTKASCSACHTVGYLGGNVGPGLGGIGRIRTERDLLEAVLFPSASFVRTFEPVIIDTKDGLTYSGIIKDENESELVLAVDATKSVRIPVADIEKRADSKVSIMPAGLDKQLTPQELADLIAFLKNAE